MLKKASFVVAASNGVNRVPPVEVQETAPHINVNGTARRKGDRLVNDTIGVVPFIVDFQERGLLHERPPVEHILTKRTGRAR